MSRNLKSLSALFVAMFFTTAASSAIAQTSTKPATGQLVTSVSKSSAGSTSALSNEGRLVYSNRKAAVVAVKKEGRMQLAGDKKKVIGAMQRALDSGEERAAVQDISIQSFEKVSFLAVRIEKQGTLYLRLETSGGGIQGIFYVGEEKYLYCASEGCGLCTLDMNGPGGPTCNCGGIPPTGGAPNGCRLKPRLYVSKLVADFNSELLAIGFQEAEEGASSGEGPKVEGAPRDIKSSRPSPIKRPNN